MINACTAAEKFIDLSSHAQFKDENGSFAMLSEHIREAYSDGGIEKFLTQAEATMIVKVGSEAEDNLKWFALGMELIEHERASGGETKVFWFELLGHQAYWVLNARNVNILLTRLAKALYNIK